jgi:hypothetical protein
LKGSSFKFRSVDVGNRGSINALAKLSTQMFQKAAGGQIESRLNGILNDALQKNLPQTQSGAAGVPAQPASSSSQLPAIGDSLQKSVEDNLIKGLDRLLVPKKQ